MSRTLDHNRPFAKITGYFENHPDARFEQDSMYFRADGNLCVGQKEVKSAAAPSGEDSVKEIEEWAEQQKGTGGKKALIEYAKTLEVDHDELTGKGIQALRDLVVEAYKAQVEADG